MTSSVTSVRSADGSEITVEVIGSGAPVVLIGGAFNDRSTVTGLAATLAPHFTAIGYDRRGRGGSTDATGKFAVQSEVEDLAAVIEYAGGAAAVFGHSSGAALALEGVLAGLAIDKVALYELPAVVDGNRPEPPADVFDRLVALIAAGDRDGAAELFLTEQVQVPAPVVEGMHNSPVWEFLRAQASSLPYDVAVCGPGLRLQTDRYATITTPTLVINGDQTSPWMQTASQALAAAIPGSRHVVLPGEDHNILNQPAPLDPLLRDFLGRG
ncbi:alpha/beta fold hydrolase [Nocardia sp. CDC160]|uniref:alpha/beta fold hydrolase n=1 Tax=Nocardia sp. CDC160 TaxID=3112166 RepID=UPI002DBF91B6|nr:alpha/beta hydrolase [Nocardia sp. CDC160]MEC3918016.1 alpha/beta hydrolase [Nocardia sp. CDC160]